MSDKFRDRSEAGRRLAQRLAKYADTANVRVLALPRGGVPVAFEIAQALHAPLDVFLVRKLGVPGQEELAMGAIALGGVRVLNDSVVRMLGIGEATIDRVAAREEQELVRRDRAYRGDRSAPDVTDCTVIVVDDGLATGATMRAAVAALRRLNPRRIVVAVPVGARETCDDLAAEADELVCLASPEPFYAVGLWYQNFLQTSDDEVRALLRQAETAASAPVTRL